MVRGLWAGWVLLLIGCGDPLDLDGRDGGIHAGGFVDRHGPQLRATGDDLTPCLSCHTPTEGPGACNDCHTEGPDACSVCHRTPDPPHATHADFACGTCHATPAAVGTPGHLEDRGDADVRLVGLAAIAPHVPSYAAGTCANTACHGGPGAADPNPTWGGVRSGPVCASCHGLPPPNHPQDRCDRCHGETIDATGALVAGGPHLDGRVQATDWRALPCDGCHGMAGQPAPATGAHATHLQPAYSAPVACATCHPVPGQVETPGHVDGTVDVIGATFAAGSCTTGCHGLDQPTWKGTAPCGSCHGLPPPAPHPASAECDRCHLVAGPDTTIAQPAGHVDGQLDVHQLGPGDCATCHEARIRPGASHPAHARFACTTCHLPPGPTVADHLDGEAPVLLAAGRFEAGMCSNTTCHGPGVPVWGGAIDGCTSCHGNPPAPHPVGECASCHPAADDARHVNGTVDVVFVQGCDACHGNPPADASHQAHAHPAGSAPVACATCHRVPEDPSDPGHIDPGPAEVTLANGVYALGTCSDTTCHARPGATDPTPAWGDRARQCGDCHGVPPPRHLRGACGTCHAAVAEDYNIRNPALHGDGVVEFQ